ncbi:MULTISPECIES: tetratricopeptide repeat protein [unclassified Chryseobacterium]|uniref:transcriptional regulator n=1 Tax=unclassified Chryseobacterium TaxID=2593645 RepID=UPI0022699C55|nr:MULTISPECIES: tetratricopeptide repeat protein [unclassified Chryseobacterium]
MLLFILLSNHAICQSNEVEKIDVLLLRAYKNHKNYKNILELEDAKEANVLAKKINDPERIAESTFSIARALSSLELQRESLLAIEEGLKLSYTKGDPLLQAKFKDIKAYNFNALSLKSEGRKELDDILKLLKGRKDTTAIKLQSKIYSNIGHLYFDDDNPDSALAYYRKREKEIRKLPEYIAYANYVDHYISMGNAFLKMKKNDSALYYFQKSYDVSRQYNDYSLFLSYMSLGKYYHQNKDYKKALDFNLKSLEEVDKKSMNIMGFIKIYKDTSELYGILGNNEKKTKYEKLYNENQNKISADRAKNMDYAINIILKDKENQYNSSQKRKYTMIFAGVFILILLFIIIYKILHKNLKHKETFITEVTSTLEEKEKLISQKSIEKEELQQKIGDAYKEVMQLARTNDPSFYFRFQEVYPEFQKKLLENFPGLKTTELILCAYTFLGFTIKDIAEYTFKSINTIRNRKQNLRKKFSIPTETDMEDWLNNTIYPKE